MTIRKVGTDWPKINRRRFLWGTAAGIAGMAVARGEALGETLAVSDFAGLKEALQERANPGDIILLQPGVYLADVPTLTVQRSGTPERPITLRGVVSDGQRPVLDGRAVNTNRGLLQFPPGTHDWAVENLELCNARGTGQPGPAFSNNAAAARLQGDNITFRNCYSHHNDNGWFSGPGANHLLEGCETAYNGKPVGAPGNLTHNHYVNSESLIVRYCYIHHSTEGQNFKSRCRHAVLAYNWIEEDGNYSVEVASGNEQNTLWIGNVIIKRTTEPGRQRRILGAGDGTGVSRGTLALINNTIVSVHEKELFFHSHPSATTGLLLCNNIFCGPGSRLFSWQGSGRIEGAGNFIRAGLEDQAPPELVRSIVAGDPGFVDARGHDFRLRQDSPCRNAGVGEPRYRNQAGALVARVPTHQPQRRQPGETARTVVDNPDVGAFEYESSTVESVGREAP